jgi:hypothetical protein
MHKNSNKAAEPVAWLWRMHGWGVTAHSKYRTIKTYVDLCQPPIGTDQSPDFVELLPLYTAAPAQAAPDEVRDAALEEAATLCETEEIPFDVSVWQSTTKQGMSGKTALALAKRIRALKRTTSANKGEAA